MTYKFIRDERLPKLIKHSEICYPPPNPDFIDQVDTTYPGILVKYPNGYMIEDGVHRIGKLQREGIYESLFYVVTPLEYKKGLVCMVFQDLDGQTKWTDLGEWCNNSMNVQPHDK